MKKETLQASKGVSPQGSQEELKPKSPDQLLNDVFTNINTVFEESHESYKKCDVDYIDSGVVATIEAYSDGDINILDAVTNLETVRVCAESVIQRIKDFKNEHINDISNSADEYKKGYNGYFISVRSGGAMYNYKHIKEWQECEVAKKNCEDRHKQAYLSKQKSLLAISEDGEEIELPVVSYRKSSVILKKK